MCVFWMVRFGASIYRLHLTPCTSIYACLGKKQKCMDALELIHQMMCYWLSKLTCSSGLSPSICFILPAFFSFLIFLCGYSSFIRQTGKGVKIQGRHGGQLAAGWDSNPHRPHRTAAYECGWLLHHWATQAPTCIILCMKQESFKITRKSNIIMHVLWVCNMLELLLWIQQFVSLNLKSVSDITVLQTDYSITVFQLDSTNVVNCINYCGGADWGVVFLM